MNLHLHPEFIVFRTLYHKPADKPRITITADHSGNEMKKTVELDG